MSTNYETLQAWKKLSTWRHLTVLQWSSVRSRTITSVSERSFHQLILVIEANTDVSAVASCQCSIVSAFSFRAVQFWKCGRSYLNGIGTVNGAVGQLKINFGHVLDTNMLENLSTRWYTANYRDLFWIGTAITSNLSDAIPAYSDLYQSKSSYRVDITYFL